MIAFWNHFWLIAFSRVCFQWTVISPSALNPHLDLDKTQSKRFGHFAATFIFGHLKLGFLLFLMYFPFVIPCCWYLPSTAPRGQIKLFEPPPGDVLRSGAPDLSLWLRMKQGKAASGPQAAGRSSRSDCRSCACACPSQHSQASHWSLRFCGTSRFLFSLQWNWLLSGYCRQRSGWGLADLLGWRF